MVDNQFLNIKGKSDIIKLFWVGLISYTLGYFLSIAIKGIPFLICGGLQLMGLLLLIPVTLSLIEFKADNAYFKVLFTIYCLWLFTVLIRGFNLETSFLKTTLFDAFEGALYLFVPLVAVFSKSFFFYRKMFVTITVLGIIFIGYCVLSVNTLISSDLSDQLSQGAIEYSAKILSLPCGFLLLTYGYHSNKRIWLAVCVIMLTLLFAVIRARRGLVFICSYILIISLMLFIFKNQRSRFNFILKFLMLIFISFLLFYFIYTVQKGEYGLFASLISRSGEDTRSGIVFYFIQDMNPRDWIVGKGIDGQYYFPSEEGTYRSGIESDYLNIILKGGVISLGLMLLILIPAVIKGLFHSRNMFSKAAAIWILLYLLCLYPTPMTKFSLFYLIVWISAGICYSKDFRELADDTIKEYFCS